MHSQEEYQEYCAAKEHHYYHMAERYCTEEKVLEKLLALEVFQKILLEEDWAYSLDVRNSVSDKIKEYLLCNGLDFYDCEYISDQLMRAVREIKPEKITIESLKNWCEREMKK